MQFRLLGPVEVEEQGRLLPLGSAKQRALLAILLLHANEVVSRDRLIDELWGERPPASALHSLEVYVSRLRKTLQSDGGERFLVTRPRAARGDRRSERSGEGAVQPVGDHRRVPRGERRQAGLARGRQGALLRE